MRYTIHNVVKRLECDVKLVTEPVDMGLYEKLVAKGKETAAEGNLEESLEAFKAAYKIKETEKILGRINKIERLMEELKDEEDEDLVELDNGLIIFRKLVERLYPHQVKFRFVDARLAYWVIPFHEPPDLVDGIKWIYDLFKDKKKGGILADDMGLGKTIQVIAALSAMFNMEVINHVLLVLPLSLIPNWTREFEKWAPGIKTKCFHGTIRERTSALQYCQRKGGVCMTTYGLVQTQWEQLGQTEYRSEFVWDYIILDEGHKIKNPTKTTKSLHSIPSKNRLILTGTPIQNNLRELWALFDWIMQGTLLGTQKTFRSEYENPITRARKRGASGTDIHLGNYMAESLRKIVDPYIMRRTTGSVSTVKPKGSTVDESQMGNSVKKPSFPKLKKKNDFVIWTYLSDVQENIYRDFLQQESIKELLASKRSPLVQLNVLKKICDHPRLLSRRACHGLGLEANESIVEEEIDSERFKECAANRIDNISDETLIKESGKLQFLIELLVMLKEEGHRTLIFSLSQKVLNIIQRILLNKRFKVMRLDGTITKLSERELRVNKFQNDASYEVFLLTTQVGGVGLNLTAADRVVIFDPSWNPATDAQAVDRIYRIGQEKNVVVYRLITCGTVEEKIYRRQIFKDFIIKQSTVDNKDPYRYFTNQELRELFQLESTTDSVTQRQLQELHSEQRCLDPKLDEHLARIHMLPMFGVSDHNVMFSQAPDDVDPEMIDEHRESIKDKVASARVRVEAEARGFTGTERAESRWGEFETKPTVSQPKIPETEPVYPVEGLYDKIKSLQLVEEAVDKIFENNADDKSILVADSPAKEESRVAEDSAIEIEESFVSNSVVKSTSNTPSMSLFETDISCIQQSGQGVSDYLDNNVESLLEEALNESALSRGKSNLADESDSGRLGEEIKNVTRGSVAESEHSMDEHVLDGSEQSGDDGVLDETDSEDESMLKRYSLNADVSAHKSPASKGDPNYLPDYDECLYGDGSDSETRMSNAESDMRPVDSETRAADSDIDSDTQSVNSKTRQVDSDGATGDVTDDERPRLEIDHRNDNDFLVEDSDDEVVQRVVRGKISWTISESSDSEKDESFQTAVYPVEGLYDKIKSLQLVEEAVDKIFENNASPASKGDPNYLPDYDECLYGDGSDSETRMSNAESDMRPVDSETRAADSDIDSDTQSVNSKTRQVDSDGATGDVTDDERPRLEIDHRNDDDFLVEDSDDEVVQRVVREKISWTISESSDSEKDESFQTAPYDTSRTPGAFFTPAPNRGKARRRSSAAQLRSLDLSDDSAVADDTYRMPNSILKASQKEDLIVLETPVQKNRKVSFQTPKRTPLRDLIKARSAACKSGLTPTNLCLKPGMKMKGEENTFIKSKLPVRKEAAKFHSKNASNNIATEKLSSIKENCSLPDKICDPGCDSLGQLDEKSRWRDRVEVITKLDHEERKKFAAEILSEVSKAVDVSESNTARSEPSNILSAKSANLETVLSENKNEPTTTISTLQMHHFDCDVASTQFNMTASCAQHIDDTAAVTVSLPNAVSQQIDTGSQKEHPSVDLDAVTLDSDPISKQQISAPSQLSKSELHKDEPNVDLGAVKLDFDPISKQNSQIPDRSESLKDNIFTFTPSKCEVAQSQFALRPIDSVFDDQDFVDSAKIIDQGHLDLDYLENKTSGTISADLQKESLYIRFDPLLEGLGNRQSVWLLGRESDIIDFSGRVTPAANEVKDVETKDPDREPDLLCDSPPRIECEQVAPAVEHKKQGSCVSETGSASSVSSLEHVTHEKSNDTGTGIIEVLKYSEADLQNALTKCKEKWRKLSAVPEAQIKSLVDQRIKLRIILDDLQQRCAERSELLAAERAELEEHMSYQKGEHQMLNVGTKDITNRMSNLFRKMETLEASVANHEANEAKLKEHAKVLREKRSTIQGKIEDLNASTKEEIIKMNADKNSVEANFSTQMNQFKLKSRATALGIENLQKEVDRTRREKEELIKICDSLVASNEA